YGAAEVLAPKRKGNKKTGLKEEHYTEGLATSFYLGAKAADRLKDISDEIANSVGDRGFADYLKFYSNLSKAEKNAVERLRRAENKVEQLNQEYTAIQEQLSHVEAKSQRVAENVEVTKEMEAALKKSETASI